MGRAEKKYSKPEYHNKLWKITEKVLLLEKTFYFIQLFQKIRYLFKNQWSVS